MRALPVREVRLRVLVPLLATRGQHHGTVTMI